MAHRSPIFATTLAAATLLSGCVGLSDSDSTSPADDQGSEGATVNGVAMAGRFLSGQVCAFRIDGQAKGAQLGCDAIDPATSAFEITVGAYTGEVLLEIGGDARYDDEATVGDESSGTAMVGTLRSIASINGGGTATVALTPLTEAALRAASSLSYAAVSAMAQQIRASLGLGNQLDLLLVQPAADAATGEPLAYHEALRALSSLQSTAGNTLDQYLTYVAEYHASLTNAFLTALGNGLADGCHIVGTTLSCGAPGDNGGTGGMVCDTSKFQTGAPVSVPTGAQLAAFAGTYNGDEGSYETGSFVRSGSATLAFGADGAVSYNGTAYTSTSTCYENNANLGEMLYIQFGNSAHIDLFTGLKFSGVSPADGTTVVQNLDSGDTGGGGGGDTYPTTGTLGTLAIGGNPVGLLNATVPATFAPASMALNGSYQSWTATSGADEWIINLSGVSVATVAPFGSWQGSNVVGGLAAMGVAVDLAAGQFTFTNVTLNALPGSSGQMTLNGTLKVAPITGTAVTITGTGQSAVGSGFDAPPAPATTPNAVYTRYTWNNGKGITITYDHPGQPGFGASVTVGNYLSQTWYLTNPGSNATLNTSAKTLTFSDLHVPGYNGLGTSLTLNGTLTLQ